MLLTIVGTLSALSPVLAVFALIATGPRDPDRDNAFVND